MSRNSPPAERIAGSYRSTSSSPSLARQLLTRAALKLGAYVTADSACDTPPSSRGRHERWDSSAESDEQSNIVDFVLAYRRHRKIVKTKNSSKLLDDDTERRQFYHELRARGISVKIDDDPTCSLDAGRTCFALLRLTKRILECMSCINNGEDHQTGDNLKDVHYQPYTNDDDHRKHIEQLTSAQRAQIVWRILLRIGSRDTGVMSLERLIETGIITAAYPVHDGNIKLEEGEDPTNTNDRRILYENWARPGLIIPRQWKSDEMINSLIQKYYGIPVAVYFCWLRYYTMWLVGPAIAGLAWFLYGLITTQNDVPTRDICDPESQVADWILCPTRRCDASFCGFTRVLDTCGLYRWTSAATFDRPGAVIFAVFMSFWATVFQQLWAVNGWQVDERCEVNEHDDGERCVHTSTSAAYKPSAEPVHRDTPGPPSAAAAAENTVAARTDRPTSTRSPTFTFAAIRRWYLGKLSFWYRVIVFAVTLVAVAAVPILIVVYRGRAIGWLMAAVFHQDDDEHVARRRDTTHATERHRYHNFFLLNYTNSGELSNWKTAVAALCATFVQLTAIVAVHRGYSAVARWLTRYSYRSVYDPRFQICYTTFMSCFDSANYYSSLVYIAFFKGRFATGRRQNSDNASRFTNIWPISLFRSLIIHIREDVCDPAAAGTGCVPELCTQLAIIMVGKQLIDNAIELTTPLAINVWRRWQAKESRRQKKLHGKLPNAFVETLRHPKQWQLDYQLEDTGPLGLYQEYSEMVIQYGFVIMFATAFPLAPLCALLNNVLERRLDAYKMVAIQRRPVPSYYCSNKHSNTVRTGRKCCENCIKLDAWTRVLKVLSAMSILYNHATGFVYIFSDPNLTFMFIHNMYDCKAFMIAFTSDLLPRYVYSQMSSDTSSSPLDGYVAWSLSSKRNMSEYYYGNLGETDRPEICRYRGYGAGDGTGSDEYNYRQWKVLAARLTFVIIFEHCMIAAVITLAYFIRKMVIKYRNRTKILNNLSRQNPSTHDDKPPIQSFSVVSSSDGTAINTTTTVDNNLQTVIAVKNNKTHQILDEHKQQTVFNDNHSVVVVDIENNDLDTRKFLPNPSRRHQPEEIEK